MKSVFFEVIDPMGFSHRIEVYGKIQMELDGTYSGLCGHENLAHCFDQNKRGGIMLYLVQWFNGIEHPEVNRLGYKVKKELDNPY